MTLRLSEKIKNKSQYIKIIHNFLLLIINNITAIGYNLQQKPFSRVCLNEISASLQLLLKITINNFINSPFIEQI